MEETVTSIQPLSDQEKKRQALVAALVDFIADAVNTHHIALRDELRETLRDELTYEIGRELRNEVSDNVYQMFKAGDFKSHIDDAVRDVLKSGMIRDQVTDMIRDGDISVDVDVDASLSV